MRYLITLLIALASIALAVSLWPQAPARAEEKPLAAVPKNLEVLPPTRSQATQGLRDADVEPLKLDLPRPLFDGTPREIKDTTIDPALSGKLRGAFYVARGIELLSLKKPVKMSDSSPYIGSADFLTDGSKEGTDGNWVELAPGVQWAQIDLQKHSKIWAIVLWHYHRQVRVYRDVIVQVSDDPDFIQGVTTLFNNDHDNSAGLGLGSDREYIETHEGKLIDGRGIAARYVRFYSNGNTDDGQNHYIEAEVWGK